MIRIKGKKIYISKSQGFSWLALLPALFYLANLYRMTNHSATPYLVTLFVVGTVGILKSVFDKRYRSISFLLFCGIYVIFGAFNCLLIGNVSFSDLGVNLILFGITIVMFAFPMSYMQGLVFFYVSLIAFVPAYFSGLSTALVLTSSGNYISVLLVLAASI